MTGKKNETLTPPKKLTKAEREKIERELAEFTGWARSREEASGQTDTYYHEQVTRLTAVLAADDALAPSNEVTA